MSPCCTCTAFAIGPVISSAGMRDEYLDHLNQLIADQIQVSGLASVMTTKLRGRTVLRFSICSQRTTERDIENVFETLAMIGRRAHQERSATSRKSLRNAEPPFKQSGRSLARHALP